MGKQGVLLVNLGTPDSPSTSDVRTYLDEFLMDGRVIDFPVAARALLVKGIIVPFRGPKSAKLYKEIWSDTTGSPLMHYSIIQKDMLEQRLGDDYHVELAMRYQNPSIESALNKLKDAQVNSIKVIPLFPHYASATTGSVIEKVMELVRKWQTIPNISFINSFHDNEIMIEAFADSGKKHKPETYDHILFSFHGLPKRQLRKADHSKQHCQKVENCCSVMTENNKFCYSAQCFDTARLIAQKLDLPKEKYTVCFQSRLGKDPWAQPYTSVVLEERAKLGDKRILVFCPAFVADCLETVHEIAVEYAEEFEEMGGEHIQLVESLNDNPKWIDALEGLVKANN
jgi:ferrochelatase